MKTITKNTTVIITSILFLIIIYSFTARNSFNPQSAKEKIVGSWVSDSDSKSKWVFSLDNKCNRYYDGVLLNTYDFTISNTSCNSEFDSEYEYLRLVKNTEKKYCYAINGITQDGTETYLSIEYDGNLIPLLLKKQ